MNDLLSQTLVHLSNFTELKHPWNSKDAKHHCIIHNLKQKLLR